MKSEKSINLRCKLKSYNNKNKQKMGLIMQHKKRERETRLTYAFSWHLKFIDAINVKIAGIIVYATDN